MSNYIATDTDLTAVANAIRTKGGTSAALEFPDEFVSAIGNISTVNNQSKNVTPTESSQTMHPDAGYTGLDPVTVGAISSSYVGSGIARKSSSDLTAAGATVTAPAGYYSSNATKTVASGTAGTPTATKGTVSGNSVTVTPSVTNVAGYIAGGTLTGTGVTVSASELVSGSETKTANGTYDVTNLAQLIVNVSGGTGLVYEAGTYSPTSDTTRPTLSFSGTHTDRPIFGMIIDTGATAPSNNSVLYSVAASFYDFSNVVTYSTGSLYGRATYSYQSTNGQSASAVNMTGITGTSTSYLSYWFTNTEFRPSANSTSRYFRSGRTYKWIAVWKPTT